MSVIRFRLRLTEPVLAAMAGGDTNARSGFPYIPGNLIRGCLIAKYRNANPIHPFDPADEGIRRMFFDGRTRYLNAYPWDETREQRALPIPRSWYHQKHKKGEAFDLAVDTQADKANLKGLGVPFWVRDNDTALLLAPRQRLTVHTQRERKAGRATESDGAVYRYGALDSDQWFEGLILCDQKADAETLKALLQGRLQLGTARSAGYGGAEIIDPKIGDDANWRETGGTDLETASRLVITLVSDVLVRDGNGKPDADPAAFTAEISRKLSIPLHLKEAFVASRPVSGFNRAWNLPLPQQPALVMGSVLVYDWPSELGDTADLQKLEWNGIGERRAEGFGRIVVNWLDSGRWSLSKTDANVQPPPVSPKIDPSDKASFGLARRMGERLFRQYLDRQLINRATYFTIEQPPSKAQLGRLRLAIRNELMDANRNLDRITDLIDSINNRHRIKAAYGRSRIRGKTPLLSWLSAAITQTDDEYRLEKLLDFQDRVIPNVAGIRPELTLPLRQEYLLRLLDAVLARAQKQQSRNERPEPEVNHG